MVGSPPWGVLNRLEVGVLTVMSSPASELAEEEFWGVAKEPLLLCPGVFCSGGVNSAPAPSCSGGGGVPTCKGAPAPCWPAGSAA